MTLKIIVDSTDHHELARQWIQRQSELRRNRLAMPPNCSGAVESDVCTSCATPIWVRQGSWGYCSDCKPAQHRRARMGFDG